MGQLIKNKVQPIILPKGEFTKNQKEALYSLISSIGQDNFETSHLKRAIEYQHWDKAFNNWNWISANNQNIDLIKQRAKEISLFFGDLN